MILKPRTSSLRICAASLVLGSLAAAGQTPTSHGAAVLDSMPRAKSIQQAEISPDGKYVAYIVGGKLSIASMDANSAQTIEVENNLALRNVAWSADSKQVVFLADLPEDLPAAQVWTSPIDGGMPVKRGELKGYADLPTFSPDGL